MAESGQSTSSIRSGHEIDVGKLESYLLKSVQGFKGPLNVSQFKHGQSNPTYLLKDGNKKQYVLRKKPPGTLISKTAHAVEREYRIINAMSKTNVPVPKVYTLCEDVDVIGTPFYVMEFLEGRIFSDVRMLSLPFEERRQCWISAVETLGKLHAVDFKAVGLGDYGKNSGFFQRQMRSLGKVQVAQAAVVDEDTKKAVGPLPRIDELYAWFKRNEVEDVATVVHGDFKIDNMIFHPTEPRVIGVLDWELSTIGHPLSDLSNLLQPFYVPNVGQMVGLRDIKGPLPIPGAEELMKYYCQQRKISYPIPNWEFAIAFSFFRLAVIAQGIAARVARKQASSAQAKIYAEKFKPINALALEYMDKGDIQSKSRL